MSEEQQFRLALLEADYWELKLDIEYPDAAIIDVRVSVTGNVYYRITP